MTRRKVAMVAGVCVVAAGTIYVLVTNAVVCRDWAFICENTGSRKGHRDWQTGPRGNEWYRRSALEAFMLDHHPGDLSHRWTNYAVTGKTLFGAAVAHEHAQPGPILQLNLSALDVWVRHNPPEAVRKLYALFASADQAAIAPRVDAILAEVAGYDD